VLLLDFLPGREEALLSTDADARSIRKKFFFARYMEKNLIHSRLSTQEKTLRAKEVRDMKEQSFG
jgi:hypothetical protein